MYKWSKNIGLVVALVLVALAFTALPNARCNSGHAQASARAIVLDKSIVTTTQSARQDFPELAKMLDASDDNASPQVHGTPKHFNLKGFLFSPDESWFRSGSNYDRNSRTDFICFTEEIPIPLHQAPLLHPPRFRS